MHCLRGGREINQTLSPRPQPSQVAPKLKPEIRCLTAFAFIPPGIGTGDLRGEVATYTSPTGALERGLTSELFTFTANGRPAPVYRGPNECVNNYFESLYFAGEPVQALVPFIVTLTRGTGVFPRASQKTLSRSREPSEP